MLDKQELYTSFCCGQGEVWSGPMCRAFGKGKSVPATGHGSSAESQSKDSGHLPPAPRHHQLHILTLVSTGHMIEAVTMPL